KLKPYIFARLLQSILAGILTIFMFKPFHGTTETTFLPFIQQFNAQQGFLLISLIFISLLTIALLISLTVYFIQKVKIIIFFNK
ncbi:MAG: hypothetical protein ACOCRK_09075, partial [bacterium]